MTDKYSFPPSGGRFRRDRDRNDTFENETRDRRFGRRRNRDYVDNTNSDGGDSPFTPFINGLNRFRNWFVGLRTWQRLLVVFMGISVLGPMIPVLFGFVPVFILAAVLSKRSRRTYTRPEQRTTVSQPMVSPIPIPVTPSVSRTDKQPDAMDQMLELLSKDYVVLSDLNIRHKDRVAPIDYVILGNNGVFVIQVQNVKGELVIEPGNWAVRDASGHFHGLESPVIKAQRNVTILREWLKEQFGLEDIPIHELVCIPNNEVYIQGKDELPVLKAQSLPYFIETQEGSWPAGIDKLAIRDKAMRSHVITQFDPFAAFAAMSTLQQNQFLISLKEEDRGAFVNAFDQYQAVGREERQALLTEFMTQQMMDQRFDFLEKMQASTGRTPQQQVINRY